MKKLKGKQKEVAWVPDGVLLDAVIKGKTTPLMLSPSDPSTFVHIPDRYRAAYVANKAIDKMIKSR